MRRLMMLLSTLMGAMLVAVVVPLGPPEMPGQRLAVTWRDITSQKVFERALCDREEMFRRLVESTSVIPWEADLHSQRFSYIGPQAVRRFGYDRLRVALVH